MGFPSNPGFPMGSPWWPAFFPFGSQSGSYPSGVGIAPPVTSTASPPSTTSPWWVPESTTSRPGTTSPWWVPDSPTSTIKPSTAKPSSTASPVTEASVVEPVLSGTKGACGAGPFKALSLDEQKRIVGGTTAVQNSWPFVVS